MTAGRPPAAVGAVPVAGSRTLERSRYHSTGVADVLGARRCAGADAGGDVVDGDRVDVQAHRKDSRCLQCRGVERDLLEVRTLGLDLVEEIPTLAARRSNQRDADLGPAVAGEVSDPVRSVGDEAVDRKGLSDDPSVRSSDREFDRSRHRGNVRSGDHRDFGPVGHRDRADVPGDVGLRRQIGQPANRRRGCPVSVRRVC